METLKYEGMPRLSEAICTRPAVRFLGQDPARIKPVTHESSESGAIRVASEKTSVSLRASWPRRRAVEFRWDKRYLFEQMPKAEDPAPFYYALENTWSRTQ